MRAMAKESGWEINNGGVALMWRGGCIIRSAFLGKIKEAFDRNPKLANLLLDPYFAERGQPAPRRAGGGVCAAAIAHGIPLPGDDRGPGLLRRLSQRAACRPTCCKPSATTSAPTPTSASTGPAASSSTPTGPAGAARPPRRRTTSERLPAFDYPLVAPDRRRQLGLVSQRLRSGRSADQWLADHIFVTELRPSFS